MGKNKTPFTFADHQQYGEELAEMRKRLMGLGLKLDAHYPARVGASVTRAINAVDAVREGLDALLWSETRYTMDRASLDAVYYGHADDPRNDPPPKAAPLAVTEAKLADGAVTGVKAAPATTFATQPPVTVANKP